MSASGWLGHCIFCTLVGQCQGDGVLGLSVAWGNLGRRHEARGSKKIWMVLATLDKVPYSKQPSLGITSVPCLIFFPGRALFDAAAQLNDRRNASRLSKPEIVVVFTELAQRFGRQAPWNAFLRNTQQYALLGSHERGTVAL